MMFLTFFNNKTISFNKVFGESHKMRKHVKIFYTYIENDFYRTGKIKWFCTIFRPYTTSQLSDGQKFASEILKIT